HDEKLASDICYKEIRPQIPNAFAPKCFRDLVQRCCHPNPLKRPKAKHLKYILDHWYQCANGTLSHNSKCMKIMNEFLRADEQISMLLQEEEMFEQRVEMEKFTSRLLDFKLNSGSTTEITTLTEIEDNLKMKQ
ncbi:11692_t:CDS:1, partial [Scutellospora calospora]